MPCLVFSDGGSGSLNIWYSSDPNKGDPGFKPAPMPSNRGNLATFLTSDRRGVVVGGVSSSGSSTRLNEIYNPSTNTWSTGQLLPQARSYLAAFRLPDGRGAFVGGLIGTAAQSLNEIYNPSTNTWSTGVSMPTSRHALSACTLPDGRGIALGGILDSNVLKVNEIYNPSTNTWSAGTSMTIARSDFTAVLLQQGLVLVAGGFATLDTGSHDYTYVEVYNPSTNTWSAVARLPTAAMQSGAFLRSDGKVSVVGGRSYSSSIPTNNNQVYDFSSNTWSFEAPMPTARDAPNATFSVPNFGGVVVGIGGFTEVYAF